MRRLFATLALGALVLIGVTLLAGGPNDTPRTPTTSLPGTVGLRAVPAPPLTSEQIDRQDPPDPRRQHSEARAYDRRPLLNALPITLQGVRFDIGGLAADGRTTIVHTDTHDLGSTRARIAFKTLLRRVGDRSRSYRLDLKP